MTAAYGNSAYTTVHCWFMYAVGLYGAYIFLKIGRCISLIEPLQVYNTLLVDKNHRNPSAAQASSNILRCGFAAIVVAFLEDIFASVGVGWTFTIMSALCLLCLMLFALDYSWGFQWRRRALTVIEVNDGAEH